MVLEERYGEVVDGEVVGGDFRDLITSSAATGVGWVAWLAVVGLVVVLWGCVEGV